MIIFTEISKKEIKMERIKIKYELLKEDDELEGEELENKIDDKIKEEDLNISKIKKVNLIEENLPKNNGGFKVDFNIKPEKLIGKKFDIIKKELI